jgi:hypothetical protein
MDMTKFEDINDSGFISIAGELGRWSRELASAKAQSATNNQTQAPRLVPSPGAGANLGSLNQTAAPTLTGATYNGVSIARSAPLRTPSEELLADPVAIAFRLSLLSTFHSQTQGLKKHFY